MRSNLLVFKATKASRVDLNTQQLHHDAFLRNVELVRWAGSWRDRGRGRSGRRCPADDAWLDPLVRHQGQGGQRAGRGGGRAWHKKSGREEPIRWLFIWRCHDVGPLFIYFEICAYCVLGRKEMPVYLSGRNMRGHCMNV